MKRHMPVYRDRHGLAISKHKLREVPPLIFARETDALRARLAAVEAGRGFVLQGGDCAESIAVESKEEVIELVELLNEMAFGLSYYLEQPVYTVARIAGQYAKPRSAATETRDGVTLPSFMGTIVNGAEFDASEREPDPRRMVTAYRHASSVQMMIRSMITSGFLSPSQVAPSFINRNVRRAARMARGRANLFEDEALYVSHEALLLDYEECMTRMDRASGRWYNTSAHMVWIGDRTRFENSAHVEYLSGIENPIGVKVGPSARAEDVCAIAAALNPSNEKGKLVLIFRMGVRYMKKRLPELLEGTKAVRAVRMVDPMHGNTVTCVDTKLKTRSLLHITSEISFFREMCKKTGVHFGGVHLEMSGSDDVLECVDGVPHRGNTPDPLRYTTLCDPRINASQSKRLIGAIAPYTNDGAAPSRRDSEGTPR